MPTLFSLGKKHPFAKFSCLKSGYKKRKKKPKVPSWGRDKLVLITYIGLLPIRLEVDFKRVGFLLWANAFCEAWTLEPATLGLPNSHYVFCWIPKALTDPTIRSEGLVFTLDCHQHLLGSAWRLFVLFKTREYPEDLLPHWIGPSYHLHFLMASTTCNNLQKGHFEGIRKETSAPHKEAGFSCQPGHWLPSSQQTLAKMYPSTHDPRIPLEVPQLSAFYWLEEGTLPILWS